MKPFKSYRAALSLYLFSSLLLIFTACIPSLEPLYTEKDVVFDKELIGSWREKDNSPTWSFSKGENNSYDLTLTDGENSSPFVAHLFKLDGQLYIDMYPADKGFEDWKREAFFKSAIVPGHLFFKVGSLSPKFTISALEHDRLKELLEKNPKTVAHSKLAEDRIVFTASTAEMQKFLRSTSKEVWSDPGEFTRLETPAK